MRRGNQSNPNTSPLLFDSLTNTSSSKPAADGQAGLSAVSSASSLGEMANQQTASPRLSFFRQMVNSGSIAPNDVPEAPLDAPSEPAPGKAGSLGIVFTLWNTMMGSTLLVMPYTFQQAGWLLALILSIACAVISQFTCGLILDYAGPMMHDPSAEFADLAHHHYGELGRLLAFLTGNLVVMGAAVAMHGYMSTVLAHLIAFSPAHGGFCTATSPTTNTSSIDYLDLDASPRPHPTVSPCLSPLVKIWQPVHPDSPPPILVLSVLLIAYPLANLPSIRLLARLNTVGIFCFMTILLFAYTSAGVAGVDTEHSFEEEELFKPESFGIVFGIFSLSFFIHNAVMTIMRGASTPRNNPRDLAIAFFLVWICYVSMGVTANICPPLGNLTALDSKLAKNGFQSLEQPRVMAPFLVTARLAVLVQSLSVYPVLLFIVRSQLFTAFYYKRPYPGILPTLVLSALQAALTTSFTAGGVDITDVLKFAGAGGGLVCCFGLPALIHAKVHYYRGSLTLMRMAIVVALLAYGIATVVMALV